ncbi:MAG: hypothetical protein LBH62_05415 [Nitrososphaerota archaeon]|nr:hypothetical protein [Nitrososphaerota archaeon]
MNTKQISSTMGICLAFITILSMIAMPAIAAAEGRATAKHEYTYYCPCGKSWVTVWTEGYYTVSDHFTGGKADYTLGGSMAKSSFSYVTYDTIVWAEFVGRCNNCGRIITVTCWVSPPDFPNKYGHNGSWSW